MAERRLLSRAMIDPQGVMHIEERRCGRDWCVPAAKDQERGGATVDRIAVLTFDRDNLAAESNRRGEVISLMLSQCDELRAQLAERDAQIERLKEVEIVSLEQTVVAHVDTIEQLEVQIARLTEERDSLQMAHDACLELHGRCTCFACRRSPKQQEKAKC